MSGNNINTRLKRSALAVALGLCFIGGVQAQSSVGSLFGHAPAGSAITLENPQTGMKRTIHADASGRFSFSQLQPGAYKVTAEDGSVREVVVNVGTGTQVNFAGGGGNAGALDRVTVQGSRMANPIDVSSVESTTVFTAEQMEALPVASSVTNVALLAPGTVKGDTGFGNLASFGGSSVAENGYYINGFDVTNMRTMLSFADMPFQAIAQQQVKTGGYGAEFGRSLGGVISLVTKSGSNEWHYGGSVEWAPDWGREPGKDVATRDSNAANPLYVYRSDNAYEQLTYSAYASGPIIRDKLFFFAMLEGRRDTDDVYESLESRHVRNTSPQAIVKLDWNINDSNRLEFTGIRNTSKDRYVTYQNASGEYNTGRHGEVLDIYQIENGGNVGILKYTGYFGDNFTLSGQYGYLSSMMSYKTPDNPPGAGCPWAYDFGYTVNVVREFLGCFSSSTIKDLNGDPDEDVRKGFRIDAEWILGDHKLRFGVDRETYDSISRGTTYSGGINWAYYTVPDNSVASGIYAGQPGRTVNGQLVPRGAQYARSRVYQTTSASFQNVNSAAYIEDNWQVTDNFMAYLGLRWEKFENKNGDGVRWVESSYELAPRLGFAWDVNGDASVKLFGNAGRYYIPVATNSSIRASGAESTVYNWYYVSGWNDRGEPVGQGAQIGDTQVNGSLTAPHPASVASANLTPMHQDEFILGAQFQLSDLWMVGVRGTHRKVKSGMDDACMLQPFVDWAADNGYSGFDPDSVPHCYIINPGKNVQLNVDIDGDGTLELADIPSRYFGLPEYKRSYSALEFFWERAGEKFQLQGSYTFSKTRGNIEGYVNSTLEQDDPGLTQDFDHPLFMHGSFGPLPNDRTHVLKAFGAYKFNDEWLLGGSFIASSGRPINCQGYVPLELAGAEDVGTLTAYSASSFYCLEDSGERTLHQRGDQGRTPWTWTFDLSATYTPRWADGRLKLKLDVFNLFNNDRVTEYAETREAARDVFNPNFRNDVNYQSPRSLRFTVRYDY